jgi:hypothetical protein
MIGLPMGQFDQRRLAGMVVEGHAPLGIITFLTNGELVGLP